MKITRKTMCSRLARVDMRAWAMVWRKLHGKSARMAIIAKIHAEEFRDEALVIEGRREQP